MGSQSSFHAPRGPDFLGWRKNRAGATEIVYDDGYQLRMVWRVTPAAPDEAGISAALECAVASPRVLSALYDELKKRAIAIERVVN
jgi:hypothetical protein